MSYVLWGLCNITITYNLSMNNIHIDNDSYSDASPVPIVKPRVL